MLPPAIILSKQSTYEGRALLGLAATRGLPVLRANIEELGKHGEMLKACLAMPVGSVEFMRQAMAVANVKEPENLSYHDSIRPFLGRRIYPWSAADLRTVKIPRPIFVKPARTKIFTGFILLPDQQASDYSEDARDDFMAYQSAPDDEELWTSANRPFGAEWRYYVNGGQVIGFSRYDAEGEESVALPDPEMVKQAVDSAWSALKHPFALDIGIYAHNGETAVVELNDAWAIGLYGTEPHVPSAASYAEFLWARWNGLCRTPDEKCETE